MINSTESTRFCEHCYTVQPITEFRYQSRKRGRERRCRRCRNQYQKTLRARHRQDRNDQVVRDFVLEVNRARNHRRLEVLVHGMVEHFGGLQLCIQAWKEQVDRLRSERRPSKRLLDFFRAVSRLLTASDEMRPTPNELTDSELAEQILAGVEQFVVDRPDVVLLAAQAAGWTVMPPGERQ